MTSSVPISHYRQHRNCYGVGFHCGDCGASYCVDLEVVIAELVRRGVGSEDTGIQDVAKFVTKPCPKCGGASITTRPAWSRGG